MLKLNQPTFLILKGILTLPIAYLFALPFIKPEINGRVLREVQMLGITGSVIVGLVFLCAIVFYCRDLQTSLSLISPEARVASPRSVWWMFFMPFNFVEDFFIVANVARSIKNEAAKNPALAGLKSVGLWSGLGWCTAQIISLIPHELGSIGSVFALVFWIVHWRFIRSVNVRLVS
jgi:hypothetical protein